MSRPGNVHHDGRRARHEKRGLLTGLRERPAVKNPPVFVYPLLTTSTQNARETREYRPDFEYHGLPKLCSSSVVNVKCLDIDIGTVSLISVR